MRLSPGWRRSKNGQLPVRVARDPKGFERSLSYFSILESIGYYGEEAAMGASNKSWNWGESRRLQNKVDDFLPMCSFLRVRVSQIAEKLSFPEAWRSCCTWMLGLWQNRAGRVEHP